MCVSISYGPANLITQARRWLGLPKNFSQLMENRIFLKSNSCNARLWSQSALYTHKLLKTLVGFINEYANWITNEFLVHPLNFTKAVMTLLCMAPSRQDSPCPLLFPAVHAVPVPLHGPVSHPLCQVQRSRFTSFIPVQWNLSIVDTLGT